LVVTKRIGMNPFAGTYLSKITCTKCGPSEALCRWEVSYILSVELGRSLYDSLKQYFEGERIDDYICIKCSLRAFLKRYPQDPQ